MAVSSTMVTPRTTVPRPALPMNLLNPLLSQRDPSLELTVKFQIIVRDDQEIVVGRLKIPTLNGHAFILRRFDTGAISVSTMFKAAFPGVDEETERRETTWVKSNFDAGTANGSGPRRLAGVWVPLPVALYVAPNYQLGEIIIPLATAVPDPKVVLRKSNRASQPGTASNPTSPPAAVTSPGKASSPPAKRRRAESPASSASLPVLSPTTTLPVSQPSRTSRASASPARQTRRATLAAQQQAAVAAAASSDTIVEDDAEEEDTGVSGPDHNEDVAEQKALVATLKAAQEAAASNSTPVVSVAVKRSIDDEPQLTLNLAKRVDVGELQIQRKIATNSRVQMTPTRKAAAWGALAFSIGFGAVAFLPNFF